MVFLLLELIVGRYLAGIGGSRSGRAGCGVGLGWLALLQGCGWVIRKIGGEVSYREGGVICGVNSGPWIQSGLSCLSGRRVRRNQ